MLHMVRLKEVTFGLEFSNLCQKIKKRTFNKNTIKQVSTRDGFEKFDAKISAQLVEW